MTYLAVVACFAISVVARGFATKKLNWNVTSSTLAWVTLASFFNLLVGITMFVQITFSWRNTVTQPVILPIFAMCQIFTVRLPHPTRPDPA